MIYLRRVGEILIYLYKESKYQIETLETTIKLRFVLHDVKK